MARCDARTRLIAGVFIASTALVGMRPALIGLVLLTVFGALSRIRFSVVAVRIGPLLGGLVLLLAAAPFTPLRALDLGVRGLVLSATAALTAHVVPWTAAVGVLQTLHAPRIAIAFSALLARQMVSLASEVARVYRALLLRGAFDAKGGRVRAARILLVAVVPTALTRADHLADALALRGFEGRIPLARPWRPCLAEIPFYAMTITAVLAALWEKLPWIRSLFASTT